MVLLDTMNKKRQLAKREQEQQKEQSEMKRLKEKEQMNQDISMLKQKLVEHELALSSSNNQNETSQKSQKATVSSTGNNGGLMLAKIPKISPIIIRINPNSETNSDEEDEIAKKRSEAVAALKPSALEKNISLFLSEAKKLASGNSFTTDSQAKKPIEAKPTESTANSLDLDQNRKRKIAVNVNEPVESKVPKTSNTSSLADEAHLRNQLILQRQIEKEKGEMIKSLRDKINVKRFEFCFQKNLINW
jgi:hypothetical protein